MKRFDGKNLEEALEKAAEALGAPRYELKYSVVSEKRGFLGGVKRIVIEAEHQPVETEVKAAPEPARKEDRPDRDGEAPRRARARKKDDDETDSRKPRREKSGDRGGSARKPSNRKSRSNNAPKSRRDDRDDDGWVTIGPGGDDDEPQSKPEKREAARSRPDKRDNARSQERDREEPEGEKKRRPRRRRRGGRGRGKDSPAEESRPMNVEAPEQGEQSEDARDIAEWCTRMFELSQLDLVARTSENDEEILVELYGEDVPLTQKGGGELLDSIQVLVNKSKVGRRIEKRVELDAGEFKKERTEKLSKKAAEVAASVMEEGRERALGSMTPIERRIVHMTIREIEGVTTESRGRGFHKRVVILPSDEEEMEPVAAGE